MLGAMGVTSTRPRRPRLALLTGGRSVAAAEDGIPDGRLAVAEVAAEVAAVLAAATDDVVSGAPLALPLALSVCMQRHGEGADGLVEAMQLLRETVLAVSGLDAAGEPVPLVVGDARTAALVLAGYLHDLLDRAARASATPRGAVALAAAEQLV
jgi:hypothetical protein